MLVAREYPQSGRYEPTPTRLGTREKAVVLGAGALVAGGLAFWAVRRARTRKDA